VLLYLFKIYYPFNNSDEPTNVPYFSRNYGWDEIEQAEDDEKRLRQLLSIWDAERIAILKLQHDLDKNVIKRIDMTDAIVTKDVSSMI
jgi:hypothetical protein